MRQKRFVIGFVLIILLIAFGLPSVLVYREWQQQRRDKALIAAISRNDEKAVVSLLHEGANANALDDRTPPPTLQRILGQWWDRLKGKKQPRAQEKAHPALRVAVQDYYDIGTDKPDDPATRTLASRQSNSPIVQALLKHGAKVQGRDEKGDSVLWMPLLLENVSTVRLLLDQGADANDKDHFGDPCWLRGLVGAISNWCAFC